MLKGVNKRVVEVVDIENEYFEKAILFLRAGRPDSDENILRQRAGEYVRTIKYRPRRGFPWKKALLLGLAAAVVLGMGLWYGGWMAERRPGGGAPRGLPLPGSRGEGGKPRRPPVPAFP